MKGLTVLLSFMLALGGQSFTVPNTPSSPSASVLVSREIGPLFARRHRLTAVKASPPLDTNAINKSDNERASPSNKALLSFLMAFSLSLSLLAMDESSAATATTTTVDPVYSTATGAPSLYARTPRSKSALYYYSRVGVASQSTGSSSSSCSSSCPSLEATTLGEEFVLRQGMEAIENIGMASFCGISALQVVGKKEDDKDQE